MRINLPSAYYQRVLIIKNPLPRRLQGKCDIDKLKVLKILRLHVYLLYMVVFIDCIDFKFQFALARLQLQ